MNYPATRSNYDGLSNWYDWFTSSEKPFTEAGLHLLDIQSNERVLEIGCGTGNALEKMAIPGSQVVGLDLSSGMLVRARHVVARFRSKTKKWSGVLPVALCQGNAVHLPFSSNSYSAVFLCFTLELFPETEIQQVLAECCRILRWDGRIGVVSLAKENACAVRVYEWFHSQWPQVVDCRPIDIQAWLNNAGLKVQKARRMVMWGLPVDITIGGNV